MSHQEQVERVRQQIMRYRELLDVMRMRLEDGEQRYERLLARYPVEDREQLKVKELQWKVAEQMLDDVKPLSKVVAQARFDCRELMMAFEELHDIIMTRYEPDEE